MQIFEMFESTAKRVVVTYPGRFQPFHKGHRDVFHSLQSQFGSDNVYIVSSDKVEPPKSPFSFSDKVQFMRAAGIPAHSIINAAKVYDLPQQFDTDKSNIVFVTAVGAPEAKRLGTGGSKKDGSPAYFQPWTGDMKNVQTADKHGYVIVEPEHPESIEIAGKKVDVSHGTPTRALWNEIKGDPELRKQFIQQMYGKYHAELEPILDKISEGYAHGFADPRAPRLGGRRQNDEPDAVNNIEVSINGRPWKVFAGKGLDSSTEFFRQKQMVDAMCKRKTEQSGKKWSWAVTGAPATMEAANPAQQAAIAINMKKHNKKPKDMSEAEGEEEYYYRVRHQTKKDIELEMPPKAWDAVGPAYATYEEAKEAFEQLKAKHPDERFTYTRHPRISYMGGKPQQVFPEGVAEGATGAKPGWMLKQDPALAKKVKDSKRGHEELKKWAGKPVPKDSKQVEEGAELKQAKRKYNQAAKDANDDQVGAGKKIDTMKKSLRQKDVDNKKQGVAEGMPLGKVLSFPNLVGQVKHILDAKHGDIGWKMSKRDDDVFLFSAMNDYNVRSMLVVAKVKDGWVSATNGMVDPHGEVEMYDEQELPMTLASASEIADEAISTYHDIDLSDYADQDELNENAEELNIGDPVIITGDVEFNGKTGDIAEFGRDKRFVVVNLYNHGKHSFHSSDVEYNDHADHDVDEGWFSSEPESKDPWFLKKDGDVMRSPTGTPLKFKSKQEAIQWAMKTFKVSFDKQRIIPTTNPDKNLITTGSIAEDAAAVGVVKNGKDPRYMTATMGNDNKVTADTLPQMMKNYDLIPGKKKTLEDTHLHTDYKRNRFKSLEKNKQQEEYLLKQAMNRVSNAVEEDDDNIDHAMQAFLDQGGKVDLLPYKEPRSKDKANWGSKHIGTGRPGKASNQSGRNANVGRVGKPVVAVEEELGDPSAVESAIIRRIMSQHREVLAQHGPQAVMDAAKEVADYVGDVDEIGSSDVSAWTKQTIRNLEREMYEGMFDYNKQDPYNSEFAPSAGMGRMTLRSWKQSLAKRLKELSDYAQEAASAGNIDQAAMWENIHKKMKNLNLDPIAQEIELAHSELEKIRRQGGTRSRAFQLKEMEVDGLEENWKKKLAALGLAGAIGMGAAGHAKADWVDDVFEPVQKINKVQRDIENFKRQTGVDIHRQTDRVGRGLEDVPIPGVQKIGRELRGNTTPPLVDTSPEAADNARRNAEMNAEIERERAERRAQQNREMQQVPKDKWYQGW